MCSILKENIEIEKMNLSVRLQNCLKNSNINKLDELMNLNDEDLIKIRNLGEKSLEELNVLRKNIGNGIIPLKEIEHCNFEELNFTDTKLIYLLSEEGKEIENILFYDKCGAYVEDLLIEDLNLSVRAYNILNNYGFKYASELLNIKYLEFNKIRNLGVKSKKEIVKVIKESLYITYKIDDASNKDTINLGKYIGLIINDFHNSKIGFDIKKLTVNLTPFLRDILKKNHPGKSEEEIYLEDEDIYSIYTSKYFMSLFRGEIIRNINDMGGESTLKNIIDFFPTHITKTNLILNLVDDMIKENIIEEFEGRYMVYYPTLLDILRNINNEKDKLIIENRFSGKTLEEVGVELDITRERVRQRELRVIKNIPRIKEDRFKTIFNRYDWNKEAFTNAFEVDSNVYYYLNYKYKGGTVELEKAIEDNSIPVKVRQKIENILYKDYLLLGNIRIKKEKQHILDYVLKLFCKDEISVGDLNDIYTMFLEDLNLDIDKFKYPPRYFESTLANSNRVLWKFKKRLRYFDFSDFDQEKIISSLGLGNYSNIEISTLKIFNDYSEIMNEWGIKDEYELHNLMKKIIGDKNNLGIRFLRMPNIEFGNADRDMQVLELLIQSAPIQNYELAKLYELEYGVKAETALANYFKAIEEYYHEGMYSIDYECLNQYELEEMKKKLNDDIYLLNELKDLYGRNLTKSDIGKINPYSLRCLGFKVTSLFIYSDKFNSIEDCIKNKISNDGVFDGTDLMRRFGSYQSFYNIIRSKTFEYEIIEFEPNIFISRERLESRGVTKDDLLDFVRSVDEFINEEVFTIKFLRKKGFEHYLYDLGFDDMFYSSILKCNEKYKSRKVDGNIILKKSKDELTLNDLVEHIVIKFRKIDVYDLIDYIREEYGVNVNRWKISQIASEKELYYDAIMERIYIDYDEYFEEV